MFTLPELPYAYTALEPFIDERTMQIHHDKHHAAYIKNLNDAIADNSQINQLTIDELLKNLHAVPEAIRAKVRNHGGGHYNHSLFWTTMAPAGNGGGGQPTGKLLEMITATFGRFETFQEQFAAKAMGRFGSGWAWLSLDTGKLAIEDSANQDNPLMEAVPAGRQGRVPLLGLDVWEHAYYLKYQNLRADYIKAWWNVVDWQAVAKRLTSE